MKRKLIRNCILIIILLMGIVYTHFYYGGYYLNKNESIEEYLEIQGLDDSSCVGELHHEINSSYVLYENIEKNLFKILEIKHQLLGYKIVSKFTGTMNREEVLSINGEWRKDTGMHIILRRNDPNVAYVELKMNNNNEYVFSNWLNEYSWKILEYNEWRKGKYYSYDKDGNLLDVTEF